MVIRSHRELRVYQLAFGLAREVFDITKSFPEDERFSLVDQFRRSSRSVCANLAEAFRMRRYPKDFRRKLSIAEGEAAESQVWLELALAAKYISVETFERMYEQYDHVISQILVMRDQAEKWSPHGA